MPAALNGRPIRPHPGQAADRRRRHRRLFAAGRAADAVLPRRFDRLLRAGGMFFRNGSGALGLCYVACGRLLGYVEPHINSWDCLGAVAVLEAAGGRVNDFLAGDGLLRGNPIVAGPPAVYDQLVEVFEGTPTS